MGWRVRRGSRRKALKTKDGVIVKSGLEVRLAAQIAAAGLDVNYETQTIPYTIPASDHKYKPDFVLKNGVIIEGKGEWTPEDRRKMALVKEQHPDLDIRMVFQRAQNPIRKGSKTTYATVADKIGIPWADNGVIPKAWLTEKKPRKKSTR